MDRKGLGLNNLLVDIGLDTVEDGLGSIGMWAVWRQEEKGVATAGDGVPDPLGLVKFDVVHEKNAVSGFETGEHLVL